MYNLALSYQYGRCLTVWIFQMLHELFLKVADKDRAKPNQFFPGTSLLIKEASYRCTMDEIGRRPKKFRQLHARVVSPSPPPAASQSVLSSTGSQPGLDSGLPQEETWFEAETAQVIRYAVETKNDSSSGRTSDFRSTRARSRQRIFFIGKKKFKRICPHRPESIKTTWDAVLIWQRCRKDSCQCVHPLFCWSRTWRRRLYECPCLLLLQRYWREEKYPESH